MIRLGQVPAGMTVRLVEDGPLVGAVTFDAAVPAAPVLHFSDGTEWAATLSGDSLTAAWLKTAAEVAELIDAQPRRVSLRSPIDGQVYASGSVRVERVPGGTPSTVVPSGGSITVDTVDGVVQVTYNVGGDASPEGIQDVVGAMIVAAGGTYDDEAGTITLPSGAVVDPEDVEQIVAAYLVENPPSGAAPSPWDGLTIATFGDSITWYDGRTFNPSHVEDGGDVVGYQSYMRDALGATVVNLGIDGAQMPGIRTAIRGAALSTFDAITITAGANDFRNSPGSVGAIAPIGSAFDTATFYGALQDAIEYALSVKPALYVFLITPIKGWDNTLGIMPDTYAQAFVDVGRLYSIPVCDWYHESGISLSTRAAFIGDKSSVSYDLHPTNAGYRRMADVLIPFLNARATTDLTVDEGPDVLAPSAPVDLTATPTSTTSVNLAWSPSSDNVGVTGYEYRIDGGTAVDAGSGTTETVSGLTASTEYDFEVRAYDAAGNRSEWSAVATVSTLAEDDTTPPTPGTLAASAITDTSFTLTVSGASDETALHATPYAFRINGGSWSTWQAGATFDATGLTPETQYTCDHKVRDAALNEATGSSITVETGAALGWTPEDLGASLLGWWDASDAATITASGGAVSEWRSKVGTRPMVQATGTAQPNTGTRTLNGLNVLDFDGGDWLSLSLVNMLSTTQPYSIFVVMQVDSTSGESVAFAGAQGSGYVAYIAGGTWRSSAGTVLNTGTSADTAAHLHGVIFNGGSSSYRLDAAPIGSTGNAGTNTLGRVTAGANGPTGAAPFNGCIAEAVVVSGVVSGGDLTELEAYLSEKWGTP